MPYKHITPIQRNEIAVLKRNSILQKDIAKTIGVTPSAISQEIKRNKDTDNDYDAKEAQYKTEQKRIIANQRFKKINNNEWLKKYIEKKLKNHWSPEQISGRLKVKYKRKKDEWRLIGKDSVYNYVYSERKDLVKYLRCKKGYYRRRRGTRIRAKQREEAKIKRINTRPKIVEKRKRIGDWEGDTIVGKDRKKRLLTNVDRKSGYGLIDKLDKVSMEIVHEKLKERFNKIPKKKKHTYTYDNGLEIGKEDEWLERKIKMDVYRAYPYHSWERGCNENFNGLVREFFPKGTDFANISIKEVERAERLINHRPRKRLNYKKPIEVF